MKFLGADNRLENSEIVLLGIPFDATSSFRAGSRFAPDSIRVYSDAIETYSPYCDKDLEDINFYDYGNLYVTINNFSHLSIEITKLINSFLQYKQKVLSIGGEHLITLPIVETFKNYYKDIVLIVIDAHTDLRDTYLNEKFSHATVLRRMLEFLAPENIFQFAVRSGTKEEFLFAKERINFFPFTLDIDKKIIKSLQDKKIYLSIDLDVLDPSIFPGTGTPEPGGVTFNDLINFIIKLKGLDIVGADVVELSPEYDSSGVSSIVAAKIIRELIILLQKN